MSSRPLYRAVLPAILVFSAVFSFFSLPFFWHYLQSEVEPQESAIRRDFQSALESQNRNLTIRYIGAAMVVSVVTGLGTIELRRRQRKPLESLSASVAEPLAEPLAESTFLLPLDQNAPVAFPTEEALSFRPEFCFEESFPPQGESPLTYPPAAIEEQITELELTEECETCRIWVESSGCYLLAIRLEGQFYSFVKLLPNRDLAMQTALEFSPPQRVVITPVQQGYGVWLWRSEAREELASSSVG